MVKYGPSEPVQTAADKLARFQRSQDAGSGRSTLLTQPRSPVEDHRSNIQMSKTTGKTPKRVTTSGSSPTKQPRGLPPVRVLNPLSGHLSKPSQAVGTLLLGSSAHAPASRPAHYYQQVSGHMCRILLAPESSRSVLTAQLEATQLTSMHTICIVHTVQKIYRKELECSTLSCSQARQSNGCAKSIGPLGRVDPMCSSYRRLRALTIGP